ncbi:MAG: hypothetical protein ACRDRH_15900 [Pseudonocardia sp.]
MNDGPWTWPWTPQRFGQEWTKLLEDAKRLSGKTEDEIAAEGVPGKTRKTINQWKHGEVLPRSWNEFKQILDVALTAASSTTEVDHDGWRLGFDQAKAAKKKDDVGRFRKGTADPAEIRTWNDSTVASVAAELDHLSGAIQLVRFDDRPDRGLRLGVHSGPELELTDEVGSGLNRHLPKFVERDKDLTRKARAAIREAAENGGFILVVGEPCVGKTRLLYEIAKEELSDFVVLAPSPDQCEIIAKLGDFNDTPHRLVLWLDNLRSYLPSADTHSTTHHLSQPVLRKLLTTPNSLVILATAQQIELAMLQESLLNEIQATYYTIIFVSEFSVTERAQASAISRHDPRIGKALEQNKYFSITVALAGIPSLNDRFDRLKGLARRALEAIADLGRVGIRSPVSQDLLCSITTNSVARQSDDWDSVLCDLQRIELAVAPLLDGVEGPARSFVAPPSLHEYVGAKRRWTSVPERIWEGLVRSSDTLNPGDLVRLAGEAYGRLLFDYALYFYKLAHQRYREPYSAEWVAQIHARRGDYQALADRAQAGDLCAARWLAACYAEDGDIESAARTLKPFDSRAQEISIRISKLRLASTLRSRLDVHDWRSSDQMFQLLPGSEVAPAIQARQRVIDNWPNSTSSSEQSARINDIIPWMRGGIHSTRKLSLDAWSILHRAGHREATRELAWLLHLHDETERGLTALRPLSAGGDSAAIELTMIMDGVTNRAPSTGFYRAAKNDQGRQISAILANILEPHARIETLSALVIASGHSTFAHQLMSAYATVSPGTAENLGKFGLTSNGKVAKKVSITAQTSIPHRSDWLDHDWRSVDG